ncbi:GNAT family N-acetyltransferase [Sphaerisporangium rubeum]|uniref:GNAT superfamily N-acetyltransferase n=1 Tax=Sphaerisporangium rubeum TaxID=321317 RepID=A0A7X0ICD3_9ACTN|nr:GNAT family N-acetyltransferase [Sphaerisporangium rubeum]MBB6472465.1 GNAT superfamily N-acetyltransferase [Sphaerisporangium rubeum]
MTWTFTGDVDEFPAPADAWLRRDPVLNTVPLTVLARVRSGLWSDDLLLGWHTSGGEVTGAVLRTPPYSLLLGDIPVPAVTELALELRDRDIPAVTGPREQAEAFTAAYGMAPGERVDHRLYRLGALIAPRLEGTPRVALEGDVPAVAAWMAAFLAEAEPQRRATDVRPQVEHRVARGEFVLWEDEGRPVAMAAFSAPLVGMSRIGPVYTPPELRGRGYGSAVTYAATRAAQDAGAGLLLLFTDLANPTSNSIYQAIGYRPVADYAEITFTVATAPV